MNTTQLVFVNIGWMRDYAGMSDDDPTLGGHGYLKANKSGHEAWNFSPFRKNVYGYVPRQARINIANLGGLRSDDRAQGITVVWIAKNPRNRKTYIVGWYQGATVFSKNDHLTLDRQGGICVGYQIVASADQATLLPVSARLFLIPTTKAKGNLGQSPVWYGGTDAFRARVGAYVQAGGTFPKSEKNSGPGKRQTDPELRKKIELAAVRHATEFYKSVEGGSRTVHSVERDGVGWDLNVTAPTGEVLKVEVKGLSGSEITVELTPNEYMKMLSPAIRTDYVVYIVTEADTSRANSHIFLHDKASSKGKSLVWATADGRLLKIEERIAARLSAHL